MLRKLILFTITSIFLVLSQPTFSKEKSLKKIKEEIIQESKAIKKIKNKKYSILSLIKKNEFNIQNINQYLYKLDFIKKKLDKNIKKKQKVIHHLKKSILLKERWIHKRIRFLFIHQKQKFNSFFNIKKESNWIKSFLFIKKFVEADHKIIKEINKKEILYKTLIIELENKKLENKKLEKIKSQEFQKYSKKIKVFQKKIKKLSTNEKNRNNILAELKQFERKLLKEQLKKSKFSFAKTQITCSPLKNFKVISNYGLQRHLKLRTKRNNLGSEIIGKPGQKILAVAKGEVLYVNTIPGYGKGIIIYHGSDYYVIYGNLQNINVNVGDKLLGCESIATIPNTQQSSSRTIYFEVRKNKNSINPLNWLKRIL